MYFLLFFEKLHFWQIRKILDRIKCRESRRELGDVTITWENDWLFGCCLKTKRRTRTAGPKQLTELLEHSICYYFLNPVLWLDYI